MIPSYTASSVKKALESMKPDGSFRVEQSDIDRLKCPITGERPDDALNICHGNHIGCVNRKYQLCIRRVHVYINAYFSYNLSFSFTVSDDDRDGYIRKNDSTLRWLIEDKKAINEADLVPVNI